MYLEPKLGVIYWFLAVIAFSLCALFLYNVLRALLHIFSKKGRKLIQRFRKNKFFPKKNATNPRSEAVIPKSNDEIIRRRNGSPNKYGGVLTRTSHRDDSNSKDNKNKDASTSKYSILSLDWRDHHDSDERDE